MDLCRQERFEQFAGRDDLLISYSGTVWTDGTWKKEPTHQGFSRLMYVREGSGMLLGERERVPIEAGRVYLAPCGMKCGFYGTPCVELLFFHINLSFLPSGNDVFEPFTHFVSLPRDVGRIGRLMEWYRADDPLSYFLLKSEICGTLCEFLAAGGDAYIGKRVFSEPVAEAIAYIRWNLTAALTVQEVAKAVFCSRSTLSDLFSAEVGQSIARYIEDLVMSEAQTMLLYSARSIGQISETLGFCDQFYFSGRFRKRFGISPREYRGTA